MCGYKKVYTHQLLELRLYTRVLISYRVLYNRIRTEIAGLGRPEKMCQ